MHKIWIGGLLECVPYIAELFPGEPWLWAVFPGAGGGLEAEHTDTEGDAEREGP